MSTFLCRVLINSRHNGDTINLREVDSREGADTWNTSMKWININETFFVKYKCVRFAIDYFLRGNKQ